MSPTMQARRARVRQIRRTVTAVAVTVFIALFATIFIQMALGKDPALGSSTNTAQVSETSTTSAASDESTSSSDDESDDDSSSQDSSSSSSSPMTTSQS
jgi:cytoskeletal protein RodZ